MPQKSSRFQLRRDITVKGVTIKAGTPFVEVTPLVDVDIDTAYAHITKLACEPETSVVPTSHGKPKS